MVSLPLEVVAGHFAIGRLSPGDPLPDWAVAGPFCSFTRTPDELSVVCPEDGVPDGVRAERGWRCLRVAGMLDFGQVGVLAALLTPLARAGVPVFVVSTFDTDYLLIPGGRFDAALEALRQAGHRVD
jgi:hypothetical protein